ncbi:MAG TPA: hypothetical protein VG346_12025 [Acidimicrobiales bacterium]|nr:hypothetical protein [Acidimicrobiales bacterium]
MEDERVADNIRATVGQRDIDDVALDPLDLHPVDLLKALTDRQRRRRSVHAGDVHPVNGQKQRFDPRTATELDDLVAALDGAITDESDQLLAGCGREPRDVLQRLSFVDVLEGGEPAIGESWLYHGNPSF